MASVGHIAVAMAAARVYSDAPVRPRRSSILFWSALSMLPDADVIAFALGIDYPAPWGHRGATHSLLFALAVAATAALAAPRFGFRAGRTFVVASVVVASHGLLDTLTDGGLGCALLWPFNLTRYFAPWRPIPVSPIGLGFLSPYGLFVAMTEIVLFAPLVIFALRPRLKRRYWLPLWIAAVWLIGSSDRIRDAILGFALREDTRYAPAFSKDRFQRVVSGLSVSAAICEGLGPDLVESSQRTFRAAPPSTRGRGGVSSSRSASCRQSRCKVPRPLVTAASTRGHKHHRYRRAHRAMGLIYGVIDT